MDLLNLAAKVQDLGTVENLKTHGITITLSGIIIVFSMLVLLVLIIGAFGLLMSKMSRTPNDSKPVIDKKTEKKVVVPASPVQNTVLDSDSDDVIAAISAAVMMMYEGTGKTPVIRSIRPAAKGVRSAWGMAGVMNNTRPF